MSEITDEMIEAGCAAIVEARGYVWPQGFDEDEIKTGRENMRLALAAALTSRSGSYLASVAEERDAALAEVAKFREASRAAYLGLQVLKTMCRKKGLTGGVEATESAMRGLVDAMPELPALSALRGPVVIAEAKP